MVNTKPFLKWAGGKTQLLAQYSKYLPPELFTGDITTYIEPFVGSGALLFYIAENTPIKNIIIMDINKDLILAYKTVKYDVEGLIRVLKEFEIGFKSLNKQSQKEYFYNVRKRFNQSRKEINYQSFESNWIDRTAQLIFLNRTCFNGLYRLNLKGEFNVPFGNYKNPTICNEANLKKVSIVLANIRIENSDFEKCHNFVDEQTFVYFDPPYRPISKTSSFTAYSSNIFDDQEQIRLANFYRELDKKGAYLLLSNSDPKNIDKNDKFFESLYDGYRINRVIAKRIINSNPNGRGEIYELVITNYKDDNMKLKRYFIEKTKCHTHDELFQYLVTNLTESITLWDYFVNWEKVKGNIHNWEIDLNALNYLVGKENIEQAFKKLLVERPRIIQLLPVLLASRKKQFKILIDYTHEDLKYLNYDFSETRLLSNEEIDRAYEFAYHTGLLDIFSNKYVKSIPDYVIGIEVGLDSNARKNRGGTSMEKIIGYHIEIICKKYSFEYLKQATPKKLEQWGKTIKIKKVKPRFDFAVNTGKKVFLIETNYYGGGGSKLKSTAGEYQTFYDILTEQGYEFIWITDGLGWEKTTKPLREAFDHLSFILNIKMVMNGLLEDIFLEK